LAKLFHHFFTFKSAAGSNTNAANAIEAKNNHITLPPLKVLNKCEGQVANRFCDGRMPGITTTGP
jgi:hypothetical protein